jgi:phospholipase C
LARIEALITFSLPINHPAGQSVSNLLSKGIVNKDGSAGPNYYLSAQYAAVDSSGSFTNSPQGKSIYSTLPPAMTDGAPQSASDSSPAPFQTLAVAKLAEPDLAPSYNKYLLTGATGLPGNSIDTRLPDATTLREGPYQITPSISYDAYTASPVHRFFQMWQQTDCNVVYATADNPSGCLNDLFPWVETSVGTGSNGNPQPADFSITSTGEGSAAMQFYNVQRGDAPYMKKLAETYTLSDNFHQSVMGGTGANHIMFGFADAIWYSDGKGHAAKPPTPQIENPNPQTGTDNYYDQDGYSGGSYVNCADIAQPGVAAVRNYLESLPNPVPDNCQASRYYIVNNYNPGYNGDGTLRANIRSSRFRPLLYRASAM